MNVKLKLMVSPAPEKFITFIKFINFRSQLYDPRIRPSRHIRYEVPSRFVAPL